ncbi:MAG: mechanosensitive ion channel [Anaerolineae bacterium]|jgi:small-conductance mechanosensitive channel|nr:mechanosensitive ion channel [Anaerolineae bacterium]MBT7188889.1 mechanosensitive ion channel [Anaerolineae bacterium]MBT7783119.1 mechanosensitive ion channel [Anaerolineae bacterium]
MENIIIWLENSMGVTPVIQGNLFETLLTIMILWLIQRLLVSISKKAAKTVEYRYQLQKGIGYLSFIIGLIAIGRIWLTGMETVVTFLGLLSAGIAIALKDPLMNIVGWIYILARKPFDVGDRIEINDVAGDVIDLGIFQFSIMEIGNWVNADQSTGRVLHIPNGIIFTSILSNYSHGFQYIWNELEVLITFESDWRKAKKTLSKIASEFNQSDAGKVTDSGMQVPGNFMLKTGRTTPIVYTSVQESGVLLTIRYLCKPRLRRSSASTIWENILIVLAAAPDIELAYPTQRFYKQPLP